MYKMKAPNVLGATSLVFKLANFPQNGGSVFDQLIGPDINGFSVSAETDDTGCELEARVTPVRQFRRNGVSTDFQIPTRTPRRQVGSRHVFRQGPVVQAVAVDRRGGSGDWRRETQLNEISSPTFLGSTGVQFVPGQRTCQVLRQFGGLITRTDSGVHVGVPLPVVAPHFHGNDPFPANLLEPFPALEFGIVIKSVRIRVRDELGEQRAEFLGSPDVGLFIRVHAFQLDLDEVETQNPNELGEAIDIVLIGLSPIFTLVGEEVESTDILNEEV